MFDKRHRITLLFNANKAYDRQVVEGVGEYLQASQSEWDIFIEEDFRARIDNIKDWLGDGVIADYDDDDIAQLLADVEVPIIGVGGSYHLEQDYPPVHYIATDNHALVESAFLHLKEKGVNRFAFYGLPSSSGKRWAAEREYAFCQLVAKEKYQAALSIRGWKPHRKTGSTRKIVWRTGYKTLPPPNRYYRRYRCTSTTRPASLRTPAYSGSGKAVCDWDRQRRTDPLSVAGGAFIRGSGSQADGVSGR